MTEEKPDLKVIEGGQEQEEKGSEITEQEQAQIDQFYEENKDAVDMMGGMETFASLFNLPEEQFTQLKSSLLQIFTETLEEKESEHDLISIIITEGYTLEDVNKNTQESIKAIDAIDFLSTQKKEFLKQLFILLNNKIQSLVTKLVSIIEIPCELSDGTQLPTYANEGDAGLDIYSPEEYTINPGETKIIPTGIKCAIPKGYAILIQPRSGQSAKTKLRIANTPGLIDSGYRDEIGVIVENIEPPFKDIDYEFDDNGEIHIKSILHGEAFTITKGQRFAQMRLVQVPAAAFVEVNSVANLGEDRGGGFGHTGQ